MKTNERGARRGILAATVIGAGLIAAIPAVGLAQEPEASFEANPGAVTLVAYTTPREAYEEIIPLFQATDAGQGVTFEESYGPSGDQSRLVEAGLPADLVALALWPDVERLVEPGIVAADWDETPTNGIVHDSVVALAVRPGNPKGIAGWDDLVRDDVKVITPDPASSGAAKWNILAAYSQAIAAGKSEKEALDYLKKLFGNVSQWAGSGREALEAFDKGVGDVLITYENEAILALQSGKDYQYIVPDSTFLIENPGAVLKKADPVAKKWLDFVLSDKGQTEFAKKGFRPVTDVDLSDVEVKGANDPADPFPTPAHLTTVADLGGWDAVDKTWFDDGALFSQLYDAATKK
jgi:sulfate transport system substrate-binding protein